MISYNLDDINIAKISKLVTADGFNKYVYRIYGLGMHHHYHVIFKTHNHFYHKLQTETALASDCIKHLGLNWHLQGLDENTNPIISLGIRLDVRQNIEFTAKLIDTLIYALEGRLKLDKRIPVTIPTSIRDTRKSDLDLPY